LNKRLESHASRALADAPPGAPDPRILEAALQAVVEVCGIGDRGELRWIVGKSVARERSMLFPLRVISESASVSAVYKVCRPRTKPQLVQDALARSRQLTSSLAALGKDEAIRPATVLAVDPAKLTIVTIALPGRPVGRWIRQVLSSRGRGEALEVFRGIGKAARLIEQAGRPSSTDLVGSPEWNPRVERDLEMAAKVFSSREVDYLHAKLRELYQDALKDGDRTYAHGDLSRTNILVSSQGIGLIDFGWQVRLPGFDLASFMYRMEYETLVPKAWAARVSAALLEGYGDPDITTSPSWNFYRLTRLLRRATRSMDWFQNRTSTIDRARKTIRTELERV
jgi:hypothetical protein